MSSDASDHVLLVLSPEELATIVTALRAIDLHGFADRLDRLSHQARQPPES
jgi:hypothetical protein